MEINVNYRFSVIFDRPVRDHHIVLRILPREEGFQQVIEYSLNLEHFSHCRDGFGNTLLFGSVREPHDRFDVELSARVACRGDYHVRGDHLVGPFLYESAYIRFDELFREFYAQVGRDTGDNRSKILYFNNLIYDTFRYRKGSSTAGSHVRDLLTGREGVCQDFAHLLITLLRYSRIPARYATGYIEGDGETHAWVEVYVDGGWVGLDPTHNILVRDEPYIKVAHGRDFADCIVNRGVFSGDTAQRLDIMTTVTRNIQ